jgi:hypothetical protein
MLQNAPSPHGAVGEHDPLVLPALQVAGVPWQYDPVSHTEPKFAQGIPTATSTGTVHSVVVEPGAMGAQTGGTPLSELWAQSKSVLHLPFAGMVPKKTASQAASIDWSDGVMLPGAVA